MDGPTLLEARSAVDQIRTEMDTALRSLVAASASTGSNRPIARLLTGRITRLQAAADNLGQTLNSGTQPVDRRILREQLTHFHSLSVALWTVQQSLDPPNTARPSS
jgi:hypothetical protein